MLPYLISLCTATSSRFSFGGWKGGRNTYYLESFVLQSDCLFEIRYLRLHQHLYSFLSFNAIGTFLHGAKLNINAF